MKCHKPRLIFFTLLLAGSLVSGNGEPTYHVYSEDWRERECSRVLDRVQNSETDAENPPNLPGEWTSYRCEIRSGPEYLLRKYKFTETTFETHQYYYADPDCHRPMYAIVAHGTYQQRKESWVVPGATEAEFTVNKAHVIPYSQEAVDLLDNFLKSCKVLGSFKLETFRKQLFVSVHVDDNVSGSVDDLSAAKEIDCSRFLNFSLSELQLMRVEVRKRKHSNNPHYNNGEFRLKDLRHHMKKTHELFLGSVHTNRKLRIRHRPSSFQVALRNTMTRGCSVCAKIANSNDFYPPELRTHAGSILNLQGDWVSVRCESRQHGTFLTRWMSFLPDGKSWQGTYDYFKDPFCSEATFSLAAKGNYVGGSDSQIVPFSKDYSFKVTRLKVTPKTLQVRDHLNHYKGGKCGADNSWQVNVEQDVTFTNGCLTLGIELPNIEEELLKMEVVHHQLHLLVGSRFTDAPVSRFRGKRPSSFQEPLIKCDRYHRDVHINSIYEGRGIPQAAPLVSLPLKSSGLSGIPCVYNVMFLVTIVVCILRK